MRFTSSVCINFLIVSLLLTKGSRLYHGAWLIDQRLYFLEEIVIIYESLDFGSNFCQLLETQKLEEEEKKKISLVEKRATKVRDRISYFLQRYNVVTENIFDNLFPEGDQVQYEVENVNQTQTEYIKLVMEVKDFFYHDVPNYYYEISKYMGINFTDAEKNRDEEKLARARERVSQKLLNIGIENMEL